MNFQEREFMNIFYSQIKKVVLASVTLVVFSGVVQSAQADTPTVPTLVSFTMSPNSVDIATPNTTVTFDLIVNNPAGISSNQVLVTLTDGGSNSVVVPILRTDSPVNSPLQTVEFKGSYTIASNLPTGVYKATAAPVIGLTTTGSQGYSTQILSATTTSAVVGAENSLTIRNGGYLNFAYSTFTGPAFNLTLANHFVNPKFNSVALPIWKVGESFNPNDYYELVVPTLSLKVKTTTPRICTTNGVTVSLIAIGNCEFIVYTDKTLDYQYRQDIQFVSVTAARIKPNFSLGSVTTQSSTTLPLSISGPFVYGPFGLVIPVTTTPTVCYPVGSYITIISGGTCTLTYSTPASADYLASDVSTLTFEITRTTQTVAFTAPSTAALASKTLTLSATASSGAAVSFNSVSPNICSVTGNSLNLLSSGSCQVQAIQPGTATVLPASATQSITVTATTATVAKKPAARKILCMKNGKTKILTGKKCPVGYKVQK
jgi:hypothetical protein